MRQVRKRYYPQKLSYLTRTYLHRDIQLEHTSSSSSSSVGHDSIEDAAAALELYWKFANEWESSLGHPLATTTTTNNDNTNNIDRIPPKWALYLDGCNLPLGLRQCTTNNTTLNDIPQLENETKKEQPTSSHHPLKKCHPHHNDKDSSSCTISSNWQLTSKITPPSGNNKVKNEMIPSHIDWIPLFQSILSSSSTNAANTSDNNNNNQYSIFHCIQEINIMWDGASFLPKYKKQQSHNNNMDSKQVIKNHEWKEKLSSRLYLHVSDPKIEVDDLLMDIIVSKKQNSNHQTSLQTNHMEKRFVSIDKVIQILSRGLATDNSNNEDCWHEPSMYYVVVKRCGGGTKTNKKLFDKLNLRRPEEGALCLLPCLSARFQKDCLQIAKELKRKVTSNSIVQYEIHPLRSIHSIVVTDDILLANRIVQNEGSITLSYRQYQHLF